MRDNEGGLDGIGGIDVCDGCTDNKIKGNTVLGNFIDLVDDNFECDNNVWLFNDFDTASQACIQ